MQSAKNIEILAPVGGKEQLTAAVNTGANAVYFGLSDFNARRNAKNFQDIELQETIEHCHAHSVKAYITINTLISDGEYTAMQRAVDACAAFGADGLIIQDLAVAAYAKKHYPSLPRFASTQLAAHNVAGVRMLMAMGFSRVVLARELSLAEIRSIIEETGVEAEVFVHGAHCMSVSGNCYLSSMIGGRSGNRGLCAQPCRLEWAIGDSDHALSLKDLSYVSHIKELAEAGVCSLKIEGRMKRAEYVAAAVKACKDAIEGQKPDTETLRAVFSRSGFTDGYLMGKRDETMFGYRTKDDVEAAPAVLSSLAKLYSKASQGEEAVKVDMFLNAAWGEPVQLSVSDGVHNIVVTGDPAEAARTIALTEDYARESLAKTGGTGFVLGRFSCSIGDGLMMSKAAINALRREALDKLAVERSSTLSHKRVDGDSDRLPVYTQPKGHHRRYRFENAEQVFDVESGADIVLPLAEIAEKPELLNTYGQRLFAEIPAMVYAEDEKEVAAQLLELKALGLSHVVCENIGAIYMAKEAGLTAHGGMFLNIMNSYSLNEYKKLGLADAALSFELSFAKVRKLKSDIKRGAVCYGFLPLMKLRCCPAMLSGGCGACEGISTMRDRLGEEFTLLCRNRKYSELLNCVPLYIGDKSIPALDFELLYFTTEQSKQCEYMSQIFKDKAAPNFRRTTGLYFRDLQ